jgi:hypothetical protein
LRDRRDLASDAAGAARPGAISPAMPPVPPAPARSRQMLTRRALVRSEGLDRLSSRIDMRRSWIDMGCSIDRTVADQHLHALATSQR